MTKKLLIILGLALVISTLIGLLNPKAKFYKIQDTNSFEISEETYDKMMANSYNAKYVTRIEETNLPLMVMCFFGLFGAGILSMYIIEGIGKLKKNKSKIESTDKVRFPLSKEEFVGYEDLKYKQPLANPLLDKEKTLEVNPTIQNIVESKKNRTLKRKQTIITLLIVFSLSIITGVFSKFTYKPSDNIWVEVGSLMTYIILLPAISFTFGLIFALINYYFTKCFRNIFHSVSRIVAIIVSAALIFGFYTYMDDHKISFFNSSYSNDPNYVKMQDLENEYFSFKYPSSWKEKVSNLPGYLYQILLVENKNNEKCQLHIGVKANPGYNYENINVYCKQLYDLTKQKLEGTNSVLSDFTPPHLFGENISYKIFSVEHKHNNIVSYELYKVEYNSKYIVGVSFAYTSEDDLRKFERGYLELK